MEKLLQKPSENLFEQLLQNLSQNFALDVVEENPIEKYQESCVQINGTTKILEENVEHVMDNILRE